MKPTSISYSESKESFDISTGLKSWRKAGVEIELDGDDVGKAYDEARNIVSNALSFDGSGVNRFLLDEIGTWKSPTESPTESPNPYPPNVIYNSQPLPTIDYSSKDVLHDINACQNQVELKFYENDAIKHNLVLQYLEKKKSLK